MTKISSFTDLETWKQAHNLVISVYSATKSFPQTETYGLTDQMKRASLSVSSNIAEGFSRQSPKEKVQFYHIAKGSLTELQNQLIVAKDIGYLEKSIYKEIANQSIQVGKLLTGLIKSAKKR